MTLISLSNLLTQTRTDNPVVSFRNGTAIDFTQFHNDVTNAAARFAAHQRAALVCADSYLFAVGLFGLLHAGAQIILPPNGQTGTIQSLQNEFDVLVDDAVVADYGTQQTKITDLNPHTPQLIFLTSGTTGTPKKITKTLHNLEQEIAVLNDLWGQNTGTVFATVSHQHIYGLTFKILWPLMAARPFTADMHYVWEMLLAALTPDAVIISSPAHLDRLDGITPLAPIHRPKHIFSAGSPLPLRASQMSEKIFGITPQEIFGSTETGAIATRNQKTGAEPWQLLPGVQMTCDDQGALKILSVFAGDTWIETSDIVEPVKGGFHFRGRGDRIAKIEGKRIALASVEQSLEHIPFIKNAAAVMLPTDTLAAALTLNDQGHIQLAEMGAFRFGRLLRAYLAETQEPAGIPRQWRFVDALPTRNLGKHNEDELRNLFKEGA